MRTGRDVKRRVDVKESERRCLTRKAAGRTSSALTLLLG
jgi:hypothetical protein